MSKIAEALSHLFQNHRIVFWYDPEGGMRSEFEQLDLPGVIKIEVKNNAFGVKYRILREEFKEKFLLYHAGEQPADLDNWLLDVQLASGVFTADALSLWLAELGLDPVRYKEFARTHQAFLGSGKRRAALQGRIRNDISDHQLWLEMMAISLGISGDTNLRMILLQLLKELADGKTARFCELEQAGLGDQLWQDLEKVYGYKAHTPTIKDFAITLFESVFQTALNKQGRLNQEAALFLEHWQDSLQFREAYVVLADQFESLLNIPQAVQKLELAELVKHDTFQAFDRRILELMLEAVSNRTISEENCHEILRRRSIAHWYKAHFAEMYQAIDTASSFLSRLNDLQFYIESIPDGLRKYVSTWYRVDQLYRQFIYHMRGCNMPSLLSRLTDLVEKQYSNNFLRLLNDNWQVVVDQVARWGDATLDMQADFFESHVQETLRNNKVAVIISDGLRYEVGEELADRIEREAHLSAQITAMLGKLPSYTQLGMAALLPHKELEIKADGTVLADGVSTMGSENRAKILDKAIPCETRVLPDAELRAMNKDERRGLFRENQVVYIYHNQIDATGDKLLEDHIVEAVETTLVELIGLVKMLRSANFSKILVTADHGFLYQYQQLDEGDFIKVDSEGKEIYSASRRYMVGKELGSFEGTRSFKPGELGLGGNYDILIAKSVNRLRVKGASSRYVHGGASLQEVVIPVVSITQEYGPETETRSVKVDRISGSSNKITTGQISLTFYQVEPVTSRVMGRTLRAAIYAGDGSLISNTHSLQFNFASDNPKDREIVISFQLSTEAEKYNRQNVFVRLEELIPDTEKFIEYQSWVYLMDKAHFAQF